MHCAGDVEVESITKQLPLVYNPFGYTYCILV